METWIADRVRNDKQDRPRVAVTPPSTYRICPLTKFDASLARKIAAPTRSSTSPQRREGVRAISQLQNSSFFVSASVSSVLKYPGPSPLTWMPYWPQSIAMPLVSIFTAPLLAA
jgi:hypothetical protein